MEYAMATKTISIDLDAYNRLKRARRDGESFSQVIKRVVRPPLDYREWIKKVQALPLSEEAIDAIEGKVRSRPRRLRKAS
jgi:predicted CopG family antitoxin